MKSKHPVPRCCHPPSPTAHLWRTDSATHCYLRRLFRRTQKKKKEIRPLGVASIHPNGQGREIQPPPAAIFVSPANDKKEEEDRFGHWGWPRSTPTAKGREIRPPPVAIFVSSASQKKDPATQTQTKNLFLMPQKSILMPQNSFLIS
jgi:hypothetical protein